MAVVTLWIALSLLGAIPLFFHGSWMDKIYAFISRKFPKMVHDYEVVIQQGYFSFTPKYFVLIGFVFPTIGTIILYMSVITSSSLFVVLLSFVLIGAYWLPYLGLKFAAKLRENTLNEDLREFYQSFQLLLKSGASLEEAVESSLYDTKVLGTYMEPLLINWGTGLDEQVEELKEFFKNEHVSTLLTIILELSYRSSENMLETANLQQKTLNKFIETVKQDQDRAEHQLMMVSLFVLVIAGSFIMIYPLLEKAVRSMLRLSV